MNKFITILLSLTFLLISFTYSQNQVKNPFLNKITLIIDKDFYLPGEELLIHLNIDHLSNYTIQIFDTDGNSKFKVATKVIPNKVLKIKIPDYLSKGKYSLICYSEDEKYFEITTFTILHPKKFYLDCKLEYDKQSYNINDNAIVDLKFEANETISKINLKCFKYDGNESVKSDKITLRKKDETSFELKLDKYYDYLLIEARYKREDYKFYYPIPYKREKLTIHFHPEGGILTPNNVNKIAYNCHNIFNELSWFSGYIKDNEDNIVLRLNNMAPVGYFNFKPQKNKKYYFVFDDEKYFNTKVALPKTTNLPSINISSINKDSIKIKILNLNLNKNKNSYRLIARGSNSILIDKQINKIKDTLYSIPNIQNFLSIIIFDNKNNELISKRIINTKKILNAHITFKEDNFFISNINQNTFLYKSTQLSRLYNSINWELYTLDYAFNDKILKILKNNNDPNLFRILLNKYSHIQFDNKLFVYKNINIKDIVREESKFLQNNYILKSFNTVSKNVYSDKSRSLIKTPNIQPYIQQLAAGVPVKDVIMSIKSYNIKNGNIIFLDNKSFSSNFVDRGADIYIDNVNVGKNIGALNNLNPKEIKSITINTSPEKVLKYPNASSDGIIDIQLKINDKKDIYASKKIDGLFNSTHMWNYSNSDHINNKQSKLKDNIHFIIYQETNNEIFIGSKIIYE